nr:hypothetical protein Iba_chr14bCG11660 [Ipomoea batatas]GME11687.1 hypothetical protein Iba_scaffold12139CG0010 [Ipomoea batatas]
MMLGHAISITIRITYIMYGGRRRYDPNNGGKTTQEINSKDVPCKPRKKYKRRSER